LKAPGFFKPLSLQCGILVSKFALSNSTCTATHRLQRSGAEQVVRYCFDKGAKPLWWGCTSCELSCNP
jgi:hypothetical protein